MTSGIKIPKPNPKQDKFFRSDKKYIAYGGARGGGKSWALQHKILILAARYSGIRILLLRRTFPELRENHIRPLQKILHDIAVYSDSRKSFDCFNGSVVKMGYCDAENDVDQYQGQEYDIICIDEATQFSEYQFATLKGCLRGVNNFPKHMYLTCNPGGVGHGWVKRLFIDREFREAENPEDYEFIQALVTDNKPLTDSNPDYIKQLEELPESIRRAWLYGEWDVYDGQYFTEFNRDIHVIEPFPIPSEWRVYRAFDYGLDMLACLWIAVDFDGNVYVFNELCESDLIVSDAAKKILEFSDGYEIYETIAPPDMKSRQKDSGKSMAELFSDNGIDVIYANNTRVDGWLHIKELLKPIKSVSKSGEETVDTRIKIFNNCRTLIKSLPLLMHDDKNPSDCSTKPHEITHAPDALRYFAVSRELAPAKPKENDWLKDYRNKIINGSRKSSKTVRRY